MRLGPVRVTSFEAIENGMCESPGAVGRQAINRAGVMRAAVVGCAIKIAGGVLDQTRVRKAPLASGGVELIYLNSGAKILTTSVLSS
jgi:hypothetical protein